MNDPFSAARFFLDQGYWRSDEVVPESLLSRCEDAVDQAFVSEDPPIRVNTAGTVSRVDRLLDRSPAFLDLLRSSPIRDGLKILLGEAVEVANGRHNHATLNRRGDIPFRLHRDIQQWSQPLVSVFIYFERASSMNGATALVPGSHHLPYAGPQSGGGGGNWADEHAEYEHVVGQALTVEMERGEVLFLNSLCFHSVGNGISSEQTRKSMVFACRSMDPLARQGSDEFASVFGHRRFVSNEVLPVSGSLSDPRLKAE